MSENKKKNSLKSLLPSDWVVALPPWESYPPEPCPTIEVGKRLTKLLGEQSKKDLVNLVHMVQTAPYPTVADLLTGMQGPLFGTEEGKLPIRTSYILPQSKEEIDLFWRLRQQRVQRRASLDKEFKEIREKKLGD